MIQKIPIEGGASFELSKGDCLRIIDPEGSQVSDLVVFNAQDKTEYISAGKSMDFEETILLTAGNCIWSNKGHQLLKIIEDTNGRNDFLLAPCSPETFEHFYNDFSNRKGCYGNLAEQLAKFDIMSHQVPTAFNVFMNVQFQGNGKLEVLPPTSEAGDYVLFEAQIDLIGALTACSALDSNGGSLKPIHFEILKK